MLLGEKKDGGDEDGLEALVLCLGVEGGGWVVGGWVMV